jgi:DNA polymerase IV
MINESLFWKRAIILVDMNAFFAGIEQLDRPHLQGKPVVVTNGEQGTCIITCSYEARAYGIKTGMRLVVAKQLCPDLVRCSSRPKRYVAVSKAIMTALEEITPDIEVFSVDEAFLDVSRCQQLWGPPQVIGKMVKRKVFEASGLACSIGISGDKTTAKYAAKIQKPNGFTVIPPWEAKQRLCRVPVTQLCGIAAGIGTFLAKHGVFTCGDMEKLPIGVLAKRFGNLGRRIWYMCQGMDPDPLHQVTPAPKSMGHGKVIPPNTSDKQVILTYLLHMSEKLGARLRRHAMEAQHFFVGLRSLSYGWIGAQVKAIYPTQDGNQIYQLCVEVINDTWRQQPVCQVQVTALDPKSAKLQLDFFQRFDVKRWQVNQVMDAVNQRYGEFSLMPARLLLRSAMPNVIAPAWKPYGHRQTI